MDTTWAVILWSIPNYIPKDYPIISYEIGYHILQSLLDTSSINTQQLIVSSLPNGTTFYNITGLNDNTCYIFGVRASTVNGYGEWRVIANETLELPRVASGNPNF